MDRYGPGTPDEWEPGSEGRVLRNRLGVTDPTEAERIEAFLLGEAIPQSVGLIDSDTPFSVALLQALHRSWLDPLYPFAGKIRTVDMSKGLVRFAPAVYLDATLKDLETVLGEETPCAGMDADRLTQALARVHGETILAHPFREGNGRLVRWVLDLMASQAGRPSLAWPFYDAASASREEYYRCLRRWFAGEEAPLEWLTARALVPVGEG